MKPSKNLDELCYPFIHETSALCDFEVVTDELCGLVGAILSELTDPLWDDVRADLERLQPLVFHVNGSIRGRMAVTETDLQWLQARVNHHRSHLSQPLGGFVLPRGSSPVPHLHLARSAAKKAIRWMVRVEQEGKTVDPILPRFCNMMCNFFFVLTLTINERRGVAEVPFHSRSYG